MVEEGKYKVEAVEALSILCYHVIGLLARGPPFGTVFIMFVMSTYDGELDEIFGAATYCFLLSMMK